MVPVSLACCHACFLSPTHSMSYVRSLFTKPHQYALQSGQFDACSFREVRNPLSHFMYSTVQCLAGRPGLPQGWPGALPSVGSLPCSLRQFIYLFFCTYLTLLWLLLSFLLLLPLLLLYWLFKGCVSLVCSLLFNDSLCILHEVYLSSPVYHIDRYFYIYITYIHIYTVDVLMSN